MYVSEVSVIREIAETFISDDNPKIDTYKEDIDHIKIVFKKALESNISYESAMKYLGKELGTRSFRTQWIDAGPNAYLFVCGHWKDYCRQTLLFAKRTPVSLQELSATKIAQTLKNYGRSHLVDNLELTDASKNVVKDCLT